MDVVIVGPIQGVASELIERFEFVNRHAKQTVYRPIAILDQNPAHVGRELHGVTVVGPPEDASRFPDARFVLGEGSSRDWWSRTEVVARTGVAIDRWETFIHPTAMVSPHARLGPGSAVFEYACIGGSVEMGEFGTVDQHVVVGHHAKIGRNTLIITATVVSPYCEIGSDCFIAMNATIARTTIGDLVEVGAGSVVIKPVPSNSVVVGNPARRVRAVRGNE
jgi:sugar O-acyltransferase (sialic acid O-acetyltransferase NeuD family)